MQTNDLDRSYYLVPIPHVATAASEKMKAVFGPSGEAARSAASGKAGKVPVRTMALYQKRVGVNLKRLMKLG